jgi:hypothetical protein
MRDRLLLFGIQAFEEHRSGIGDQGAGIRDRGSGNRDQTADPFF